LSCTETFVSALPFDAPAVARLAATKLAVTIASAAAINARFLTYPSLSVVLSRF
jgi:hypothetical protein